MSQKRETYALNRSQPFDLSTGAENRTDLSLSPTTDINTSSIVTVVTTDGQNPKHNALVKVLTQNGDPLDHQFTNDDGRCISKGLDPGIYLVVASAPGYITSSPVTVNLPGATTFFLNINLTADARAQLNTLYGLVLDHTTGQRIASATAILADSSGTTVETTQTDNDGEYLFCQIASGNYTVTATKTGYELLNPLDVVLSGSQIAQTNLSLTPEVSPMATVQGFIRDQGGSFLGGASVGLYTVSGNDETLYKITYTNTNGFYLFGDVPAGRYLVKSNVEASV